MCDCQKKAPQPGDIVRGLPFGAKTPVVGMLLSREMGADVEEVLVSHVVRVPTLVTSRGALKSFEVLVPSGGCEG